MLIGTIFVRSISSRLDHKLGLHRLSRNLDPNHLVSVGDEGMRSNGNTQVAHSWLNNGYDGVSAECNWAVKDVDVATLHTYPDQ